jgi:hypothetical protein
MKPYASVLFPVMLMALAAMQQPCARHAHRGL